ncbi:MAG: tetratricopeptide repeat protein [Planctomycetes bacterium]|nr:tetratricopeptide repeat protein [Planctomycetota bacterium]
MALLAHAASLALLCCSAGAAQQPVRLDLDLEIEAEAPPYGDRGPCTSLGHVTSADGQLFVWAESEALDPFLAIESADGSLKVSDDNLGGGTTAWLRVTVKAGTELEIVVAGPDARAVGPVRVHLREMSENAASKEARGALESALLEAALLEARGDLLGARSRVAPAAAKLLAVGGIELDAAAHGALWRAGESLLNWGAREQSLEILQALVRFADGRYPPLSRARLQPMAALCGVLAELGRSAEALPWCEACVSLADRGFGEHSIEAAAARHNLGLTLLVGGDLRRGGPADPRRGGDPRPRLRSRRSAHRPGAVVPGLPAVSAGRAGGSAQARGTGRAHALPDARPHRSAVARGAHELGLHPGCPR